jgi:hypothetical protein
MRAGKKELGVDFIGGVGLLTKEEEKRITVVAHSCFVFLSVLVANSPKTGHEATK